MQAGTRFEHVANVLDGSNQMEAVIMVRANADLLTTVLNHHVTTTT
jgi:hypothetical protein